ncbi:energy transducer TonB [Maricurvus nonylphenolicus]|uniref:energy transducer TonB n=1 Tax=Maricurvus nonylphenolicus TaxID=1008307 RepID=UPI0036F39D5B
MGALFASLALHWLIFNQQSHQEQVISLAGGAQQLPIAVNFSVAAAAKPTPPVPTKPKKVTKQEQPVQKKRVKEVVKATNAPAEVKAPAIPPQQEVADNVEEKVVEEIAQQNQEEVQEPAQQEQAIAAQAATTAEQPPGLESIPVVREVSYRQVPQPPIYPKTALRRKQQGEVWVQALVSPEGNTEQVEVVRSSGVASLDASALKAVSGWVFEAAKMDGRPIRAWIEVPVAFELRR